MRLIESGCTHQGNEVFSPRLLIVRATPADLKSRIVTEFESFGAHFRRYSGCTLLYTIMCECSGHSGGEIPVPIPNTADKLSHVPYCTKVREPFGTETLSTAKSRGLENHEVIFA